MTPCEHCHLSPATVHITRISDNRSTVSHLCEACAREQGIMVEMHQDGTPAAENADPRRQDHLPLDQKDGATTDTRECGHCHMKFSEFQATGLLGCARCYEEFEKDIDEILVRTHGATTHTGKQYTPHNAEVPAGPDLDRLRRELSDAIGREEFELAAQLRDAIRDAGANLPAPSADV